jgi:MHS family citrate/tricarballylate:H+ symporter-like MFS transporter
MAAALNVEAENLAGVDRRPIPLRHVVAVFIGNGLEFYDFLTYSYFAVYIGRTFFPSNDSALSLLASLATFGAGFLTRPIGAIVIGGMGDKRGRKPAMLLSFSLMGFAISGLALTPSYSTIGVAAPVLVVLFRLLQGFALGGEVGPTTAFMAESAPPKRRGLYLSMQYVTQDASTLIAGFVGVALASVLTDQELQDWGWRVALLIGAAIVPFGVMVRRTLPETLERAADPAPMSERTGALKRLRTGVKSNARLVVLGLIMIAATTISAYSGGYMTTYALTTLGLPAAAAFGVTIVNGGCSVVFELLSGWLSDRFGRKPVMIVPCILLVLSIYPAFLIIDRFRNALALYGASAVMVMFASMASVPALATITESLPKSVRSGTLATTYAFAVAIFGGSTQFMIALLIRITGNPLMPAFYWGAAMSAGLIAMLMVRESAPAKVAIPTPV